MYVFDPSTGQVQCASCIPSGEPPTILKTDTGFGANGHNYDVEASVSGRFMSDDGRVAFSTADALVPGDTNQKIDVYEFVENGAKLITSGTDERDRQGGAVFYPTLNTGFEAISRDGVDLYFSTFETLVPEDHNGSFVKFYDARTGGGFPIRTELLPCAAADECHGDTSTTPQQFAMGTLGDLGARRQPPGEEGDKKKKKKKKRQGAKKRKRGKHGRACPMRTATRTPPAGAACSRSPRSPRASARSAPTPPRRSRPSSMTVSTSQAGGHPDIDIQSTLDTRFTVADPTNCYCADAERSRPSTSRPASSATRTPCRPARCSS